VSEALLRLTTALADARNAADELDRCDLPAAISALGALEGVKAELLSRVIVPETSAPTAPADAQPERLLSATEASARLGVSQDWLYEHAPRLKFALRVGRRWKFREAGLDAWIRRRAGC
jgi:excisionase family DNA binding protein